MLQLKRITVKGLRSIKEQNFPLQDFNILIGRNNAGKSNVLQAIKYLLEATGRDVSDGDFYRGENESLEQIELVGEFFVPPEYLILCEERHRVRIQECIVDNKLITRRFISKLTGGKNEVGRLQLWQPDKNEYGNPTGIENALKQLLPEVIFIEAFKDPTQEAQGKSTAVLGKILKQIVEQVSSQISKSVDSAIKVAEIKFNAQFEGDEIFLDERPDELKRVERRIKSHIQDIFVGSDVRLKFNLPKIDDLIATATVELKDRGPWTLPDGKGQGFQRVLYVALLQTLAEELRNESNEINRPFILLYEEPEAFLHPALQKEVGNILESISKTNQVVLASHSPLLVTPARLENILILRQEMPPLPHATKLFIPTSSLIFDEEEKQIALMLKLNHSADFLFADCVLVVEGYSDRVLIESCLSKMKEKPAIKIRSIAVVEAGSKDVVHVWVKYLQAMGFPAKGMVDLDYVWDGAGRILKEHDLLNKLNDKFWERAQKDDICETKKGGKLSIRRKGAAFKFLNSEEDFAEMVTAIRKDLMQKDIWVISQGEIEGYFGLTENKKNQYLPKSREIRTGTLSVPAEIEEIINWLIV